MGGLPDSGTIHVRYLTSFFGGGFGFSDQQYTLSPVAPVGITSPAPGSAIATTSATFSGAHVTGDLQHWLFVGTGRAGTNNLVDRDLGTVATTVVSGLPRSGTVYVRYWTRRAAGWRFTDHH
jgi:hypothetical protein